MQGYFSEITDSRQPGKVEHDLVEIVVMVVIAVLASCNYWEEIADYCSVNITWLRENVGLTLKNGVPSHDTFQRVFQIINPAEFEKCFVEWVRSVHKATDGEIVSIDGKTCRGSKSLKSKAIHMVSAWSSANNLVFGQTKVTKKSNEIKAIPALLKMLEIRNCIVTIDAMGCQKAIAKQIIEENHADYLFGLKGNQETLLKEAIESFENCGDIETVVTNDKGHGRQEERMYSVIEIRKEEWAGLKSFGRVISTVTTKKRTTVETRYFATSLSDTAVFAKAVREHWGIENSLHWCLDIAFREDESKTNVGYSAENLAVARHIAMNILKGIPIKMSVERKRKKCAYDKNFLEEVVRVL